MHEIIELQIHQLQFKDKPPSLQLSLSLHSEFGNAQSQTVALRNKIAHFHHQMLVVPRSQIVQLRVHAHYEAEIVQLDCINLTITKQAVLKSEIQRESFKVGYNMFLSEQMASQCSSEDSDLPSPIIGNVQFNECSEDDSYLNLSQNNPQRNFFENTNQQKSHSLNLSTIHNLSDNKEKEKNLNEVKRKWIIVLAAIIIGGIASYLAF